MLKKLADICLLAILVAMIGYACSLHQCNTDYERFYSARFVAVVDNLGTIQSTLATISIRIDSVMSACITMDYSLIIIYFNNGDRYAITCDIKTLALLAHQKSCGKNMANVEIFPISRSDWLRLSRILQEKKLHSKMPDELKRNSAKRTGVDEQR